MGEHEGWVEPSGLLPNGLVPSAGPLIQVLDSERWMKAEERIGELIARIQPNQPSEERRDAVANYVQQLVMKCFPCQVFTFGSVPLKTYLPDGDIDLSAFSNNQSLKENWAHQVRDMLEKEEKNESAEFRVKEVQYIQAEVKIIKCLVENIVVDISFNQLGGLCTLCFLEEVDHLINQNHLFKRSIILIKAWCYYESRILGAHHGLISTYALETLVLYIFHVFNNSFAGPLEVLYRFLEFFSNFDWDNFCVSLWGPVPVRSLPDVTAESPRKDGGNMLLSKLFLDACNSVYAVFPSGQENQGQPFVSKHFNVIDPLRMNNNLGRSVSKGNFFRIRSAFAFGAKRLARLLDCPKENLIYEVNQFFMNTWERHGSGHRPDAPASDLRLLILSDPLHIPESESFKSKTSGKKTSNDMSGRGSEGEGARSRISSHHGNHSMLRTGDSSAASNTRNQKKSSTNSNSSQVSNQVAREAISSQPMHNDKGQRTSKPDLVNEIQGRFVFARTRSSPELTDTYGDAYSQGRQSRIPESTKTRPTSVRPDISIRWKNVELENLDKQRTQSLNNDILTVRQVQSLSPNSAADTKSLSNSHHPDSGLDTPSEEFTSTGTQGMLQEEQDFVNMMASAPVHGFNGQVHLPFNLASAHLPFPTSPSFIASMGYGRGVPGMFPPNIPFFDPSYSALQFPHGLVPSLTHYFPGVGLSSNSEESAEQTNENYGSLEIDPGEPNNDSYLEHIVSSSGGLRPDNRNFEILQSDDKQQSTSSGLNVVPSSWESGPGSAMRFQQKHSKEEHGSPRGEHFDNFQSQDNLGNEDNAEERVMRSRFPSTARSSSLRSRTSSESSWDGSSAKSSKSTREKRGKKIIGEPTTAYGKGKRMSEPAYPTEDDDHEWAPLKNMGTDMAERSTVPQSVDSLDVAVPELEVQKSGSEPMFPVAPMLIGSASRQRMNDNSGVVAFYPTGPPVPFLTMLPLPYAPPGTATSDSSTSHFGTVEGLDYSGSSQTVDLSEAHDQSEDLNHPHSLEGSSVETSEENKPDILNGDFASHWQNLQYGRFCQNPRNHGPVLYSSPVMVPPTYLHGRFPWDGTARPLTGNMNLLTQLMSYGPRIVPVAPVQSVPNRQPTGFQRYMDEIPRHRSGTGTYLPNPNVAVRDRHYSGTRRGNNYDRNDNHGDREGNWNNNNSKSRPAGRYNRSQSEKSSSRPERLGSSEDLPDRSWDSYRHDSFPHTSVNGPLRTSSSQNGPPNLAYGMYPLTAMNASGMPSNGASVPPVVMLYPFDHNTTYVSPPGEQLEFGSLGPVGFSGANEQSQIEEGSNSRGAFEERRLHGGSRQRSSPDQPSSPHQRW